MSLIKTLPIPILLCAFAAVGCGGNGSIPGASSILGSGNSPIKIKVKSVPFKILFAAGKATLQVLQQEVGLGIDISEALKLVVIDDLKDGLPPGDMASLLVANSKTHDTHYWQLTPNVKMIRLSHPDAGGIDLKVRNETPLRIELWIDGSLSELNVIVELKD